MEKEEYNPLRSYLNYDFECYPDERELETIIHIACKQRAYYQNKGIRHKRTETNPRELAFYEQWLKENEPNPGVNCGHGILQDLFIEQTDTSPFSMLRNGNVVEVINERDRMIVATVIQWLGSNVGMGFLYAALNKFGHQIVPRK